MRVKVKPIAVGALGMVLKEIEEISGRIETIQTIALLRSARIFG